MNLFLFKKLQVNFICTFFVLALAGIFSSCNKPNTVGLEVQPESDQANLTFTDTVTVTTTVLREDSIRSDETFTNSTGKTEVGYMNESDFGITTANLFTQMIPNETPAIDPTTAVLDSAVLTLAYKSFYGDTTSLQSVNIYEMSETMNADSAYYSNRSFTTYAATVGSLTNFLSTTYKDSITVSGTKVAPHIRIPLNNSFAQRFIDSAATYLNVANQFVNQVKGLYVSFSPASGTGGIFTIDPLSVLSGMTLYYRQHSSDTVSIALGFSIKTAARSSYFHHDFTGATVNPYFDNTLLSGTTCFLQSMAGVKTKVLFPYLSALKNAGNISVNKAELVITIEPGTTGTYSPHDHLGLARLDSTGKEIVLPDQFYESSSYFGGTISNSTQYRFNIARYVQEIVSGKRNDFGLHLVGGSPLETPYRTIVEGGTNSNPSLKMKLQITYTKLNP